MLFDQKISYFLCVLVVLSVSERVYADDSAERAKASKDLQSLSDYIDSTDPVILSEYRASTPAGDTILHFLARYPEVGDEKSSTDRSTLNPLIEKMVKTLVAKGVDVNANNKAGETSLILAIAYNKERLAELLVDLGADITQRVQQTRVIMPEGLVMIKGDTLLHLILRTYTYDSRHSHYLWIDFLMKLLQKGVSVNVKNSLSQVPLGLALCTCQQFNPAIPLLIDHGADLNVVVNYDEKDFPAKGIVWGRYSMGSLLDMAIRHNFREKNTNSATLDSVYATHVNAKYKNKTVVEIMLEHGADVNIVDQNGATPLMFALSHVYHYNTGLLIEEIRALIAAGADVTVIATNDMLRDDMLHLSRSYYWKQGDNLLSIWARNIVHIAPLSFREQVIKDGYGDYCSTYQTSCRDITDLLLQAGVGLNHENKDGMTPLMIAEAQHHYLLEQFIAKLKRYGSYDENTVREAQQKAQKEAARKAGLWAYWKYYWNRYWKQ